MNTYSAIDAAHLVDVGYSTIRAHIRAGKLRAKRHGRALHITENELRRAYPAAFTAQDSANSVMASAHTERPDSANDSAMASAHTAELDVLRAKLEAS